MWKTSNQKEIDVAIQDQASPPFQYYLMREDKTDITLTSPAVKDDVVISVSASHGFTAAGEYMVIMENNLYTQAKVLSVSTNDITIDTPIAVGFTTGASVIRGSIEMNVDGDPTAQEFIFNMRQGDVPIDIQCIHLTIWNAAAAGDDGMFGDLTALTSGLKVVKENTINQNLGIYKTNSDFREYGGVVNYTDKAPAGVNGINITFDLKGTYGIVLRIDPSVPDILKAYVQDDIDTLNRLRISIMGQYTVGE